MAMSRVRLTADVDPDLKHLVKISAERRASSVSDWVEEAIRRELEREEGEGAPISRLSAPAFARDWDSDEDAAYDELVG